MHIPETDGRGLAGCYQGVIASAESWYEQLLQQQSHWHASCGTLDVNLLSVKRFLTVKPAWAC